MLEAAFISFDMDKVNAQTIRSSNFAFTNSGTDSNWISITIGFADGTPSQVLSDTKSTDYGQGDTFPIPQIGGTASPLRTTPAVRISCGSPVTFNYLILNNGHDSQTQVDTLLTQAGTQLAQKGVQAVMTAITKAVTTGTAAAAGGLVGDAAGSAGGAASGGLLGSVVLPIIGTIVGTVVGWLATQAFSVIFADCDGLVAAEQLSEDLPQSGSIQMGRLAFNKLRHIQAPPAIVDVGQIRSIM